MWSSSEKHFIIARSLYLKNAPLSRACRLISSLTARRLPMIIEVVGFHERVFIRSEANFTAAAFRCMYIERVRSEEQNDPARQCDAKEIETYSRRAPISRGVPLDDSKVQLIFFNLFV